MKQDFINYIKKEFNFSDDEINQFNCACSKPLKKSIRVNTNKISIDDFKKLAKNNGWQLTETSLGKNTFYIDRFEDLDTALGNTSEHQKGYFYVQELAASSSPYYMSGDKIDYSEYTILDMSASPGGKTTQLSEYYPNSIIVANEINKERFKGLFFNLDRMGSLNIVCTNYDGRFFKESEELFDKVLLDAPCSGEGTAFKTDDSLKYRNIKNIKSISKLQLSLIDSAVKTLKVGGELVYSTCTLNKLENEGVIEAVMERYKGSLEIVPLDCHSEFISESGKGQNLFNDSGSGPEGQISDNSSFIRNWPHINHTGGFFVAKIRKIKNIEKEEIKPKYSRNSLFDVKIDKKNKFSQVKKDIVQNFEKLSSKDTKFLEKYIEDNYNFSIKYKKFYRYKDEIFVTDMDISELWKKIFLYKIGVSIGKYKNGEFIPNIYLDNLR
ncbi:MAG: NOL1/NOP2/sun family putative RNA methylase [Candidatus Gracilibacteria bacterium]